MCLLRQQVTKHRTSSSVPSSSSGGAAQPPSPPFPSVSSSSFSSSSSPDQRQSHAPASLGWRPAALDQIPDLPSLSNSSVDSLSLSKTNNALRKKSSGALANTAPRPIRPLSLAAREHLSDLSNEKMFHVIDAQWLGQRVDEFLLQHHPQWPYESVRKLVEQGHIYRYRKNGKRRYTRVTDRLEFDELLVVPTDAHWEILTAPSGVRDRGVASSSSSSSATPATHTAFQDSQQNDDAKLQPKFHLSAKAREYASKMVLFKNEHVIVLNKPFNVPVHPTSAGEVNITDLLPAWRFTNAHNPMLMHTLDRETSGILVLARNKNAFRSLQRMFSSRCVTPNRVFWGVCVGRPAVNYGRVRMHLELTKDARGSKRIIARPTPTKDSRVAIAEFVVNTAALEFASFVSFYPLTARSQQQRLMAAHALRSPLLGDGMFGGESAFPQSLSLLWDVERRGLSSKSSSSSSSSSSGVEAEKTIPLHLHHRKIQLPYKNAKGEFICVTAPLPEHMKRTFERFGWPDEVDDPLIPG